MNQEIFHCGNCIYYADDKQNHGDTGICTRYPPTIFTFPMQHVIGSEPKLLVKHLRPVMGRNEICGEHVRRPEDGKLN